MKTLTANHTAARDRAFLVAAERDTLIVAEFSGTSQAEVVIFTAVAFSTSHWRDQVVGTWVTLLWFGALSHVAKELGVGLSKENQEKG